jgi:hypothetical protein
MHEKADLLRSAFVLPFARHQLADVFFRTPAVELVFRMGRKSQPRAFRAQSVRRFLSAVMLTGRTTVKSAHDLISFPRAASSSYIPRHLCHNLLVLTEEISPQDVVE